MTSDPILIVEDDKDIQENLKLFLELEGYAVHGVFNGQEALDYLRAENPARLILLDLMMPVMSGYEFLNYFKAPESIQFSHTPIVLLSASNDLEKTAQAAQIKFVKKPIDLDILMSTIQSLFQ